VPPCSAAPTPWSAPSPPIRGWFACKLGLAQHILLRRRAGAPRGLPSILFGLTVVALGHSAAVDRIFGIVVLTCLVSVFAHGLTAAPAASSYPERPPARQGKNERRPRTSARSEVSERGSRRSTTN
jgi:NhaP-type Na+/H+ or K+/H+ antiporter